jgi:hypothetical protein
MKSIQGRKEDTNIESGPIKSPLEIFDLRRLDSACVAALGSALRSVRRLLQAGLYGSLLVACNRPDKYFLIELPDVAFVVERDYVPAHIRAKATTSFKVYIPYARVPTEIVEDTLAIQKQEFGFELDRRTYGISLEYISTPQPGEVFQDLVSQSKWKILPEGFDPKYRVPVKENDSPGAAGSETLHELKSDTRYVVRCGSIWDGRGNGRTFDSFSVSIPYREFTGAKCTQMPFVFRKKEFDKWFELAQRHRAVMHQFEFTHAKSQNQRQVQIRNN